MDIRTILVNLDVDFYSPRILECAANLAKRFDAKLIGFAAAEPSNAVAGGAGAIAMAAWYAGARHEIEMRLIDLEAEFHRHVPDDLRLDWYAGIEEPIEGILAACNRVDLIVTKARSGASVTHLRTVDVGQLATAAGRPVLAIGSETSTLAFGTIVIGWKDRREARRAVADALPLLRLAKEVVVVTVSEGDRISEAASLGDVVAWLGKHEVKASETIVSAGAGGIGCSLEKFAHSLNADLIVTGAYGHSRAREWLLGGMTRELLAAEAVNRLFSN